jgi:hypothetical protein
MSHDLVYIVDYVCPYRYVNLWMDIECFLMLPCSLRMAVKLHTFVRDIIDSRYQGQVKVVFRPHIQPWHVASTITHEAGLAVSTS